MVLLQLLTWLKKRLARLGILLFQERVVVETDHLFRDTALANLVADSLGHKDDNLDVS